jgi:hypothetical protein
MLTYKTKENTVSLSFEKVEYEMETGYKIHVYDGEYLLDVIYLDSNRDLDLDYFYEGE